MFIRSARASACAAKIAPSSGRPPWGLLTLPGCLQLYLRQQSTVRSILAATLVGLVLPSGVEAKAGYEVHPGGTELILPVERSASKVISIAVNDKRRVEFRVRGPSSGIEYSVKGRVSSQRIDADFGTLGRIDVRLDLVHLTSQPSRNGRCRGRGELYGEGTYHGTIEFFGRPGVPEISANGDRFYFTRHFSRVCKRRPPQHKQGKWKRKVEEGFLDVSGKGEGRTVQLGASIFAMRRNPVRSGGVVRATSHERYEGVRVTRWVARVFEDDSLVMSKHGTKPETVEVELPEPFAGSAVYSHKGKSSSRWTGDLNVDLPGTSGIPLTGPGFSATLCRGRVHSCFYVGATR